MIMIGVTIVRVGIVLTVLMVLDGVAQRGFGSRGGIVVAHGAVLSGVGGKILANRSGMKQPTQ